MTDTAAYAATATSGRDSGPIAPPKQLGRYELIRQLGAGAMGVVMEAHDSELDRKVALKLLRKGRSDDGRRGCSARRALVAGGTLASWLHGR
jgi:serine/threonine-protein kinase